MIIISDCFIFLKVGQSTAHINQKPAIILAVMERLKLVFWRGPLPEGIIRETGVIYLSTFRVVRAKGTSTDLNPPPASHSHGCLAPHHRGVVVDIVLIDV